MNRQPFRLLIVGGGLTGCMTASFIKQHCLRNVDINIWEKSRGVGGRMRTHRSNDGQSMVDLGAQYITKTTQYAIKHQKYFDELLQAGVLKPFPGHIENSVDQKSEHFMAPKGINTVVKHFLNSSGASVKLETFCKAINLSNDEKSWKVEAKDGSSEEFHGIIVTIPVPQILKLKGNFQDLLSEHSSSLHEVQYSSRYALGLYFSEKTMVDFSWTAKFVKDHPCIRFVCVDSTKREDTSQISILIHTSVPFGLRHLESDIKEIEDTIYGYFQELFPELPRPISMRCIRWRYSQVYKSFPGQPGSLVLRENPFLVLAGDGFVHSNFSGCIESTLSVLENFQEHLSLSSL